MNNNNNELIKDVYFINGEECKDCRKDKYCDW